MHPIVSNPERVIPSHAQRFQRYAVSIIRAPGLSLRSNPGINAPPIVSNPVRVIPSHAQRFQRYAVSIIREPNCISTQASCSLLRLKLYL